MLALLCVQTIVVDSQTLDWSSPDDVFIDDLIDVSRSHSPVPNGFGIDNYVGPVFALIEASGLVSADAALEAALRYGRLKQLVELSGCVRIAASAWMSRFAVISADKDMFLKIGHVLNRINHELAW